jgi:hypothetical protein
MIRIHFEDPADSPNGRSPLRVRWSLQKDQAGRTVPVLQHGHGTGQIDKDTWHRLRAAGARIEADTERDQGIVREVLGADAIEDLS